MRSPRHSRERSGRGRLRALALAWAAILLAWPLAVAGAAEAVLETAEQKVERLERELQEARQALSQAKGRVNQLEEMVAALGGDPSGGGDRVVSEETGGEQPWSESMTRSPFHVLAPSARPLARGQTYGRVLHVSAGTVNNKANATGDQTEPYHNLLGLDNDVKIGLQAAYGILDDWDVWVQRTNGRVFVKDANTGDAASYDYWDLMTRYRVLAQEGAFADVALLGGVTYMMEDDESGTTSTNLGLVVERSCWSDRLRLGTGLLYASRSAYDATHSTGDRDEYAATKRHPDEVPNPLLGDGDPQTVAVPVTLKLALAEHWQAFAEACFPVAGYRTGRGPTLVLGGRYTTATHEFSVYFTNSSNSSFNSTLTGGYSTDRVDIFGFSVGIFY